jgi:16S rRNA A1518/A1519 N6-dimethyltransferase RsmA/KsgA/DIM1 with predicted DNA glycosylase/AP lyase activity
MTRALQHADDPADLHRFLRLAAKQTAHDIIELTSGLDVHSVLDIGAGTGAVLERLDDAQFGDA